MSSMETLKPSNTKESLSSTQRRKKVALGPGHSPMDWLKLCQRSENLLGTQGRVLRVTVSELKKHCSTTDAWISIRGRVYNITPYLNFHPGGVGEIIRGSGKDSTDLFETVHAWVNIEAILSKCFIGFLVSTD